ncbi:MAG: hypothetical protein ACR2NN_00585 [Bryobacteraceae bacterium]
MRFLGIIGLVFVSLTASQAQNASKPTELLKRAGQVVFEKDGRPQAEKLVREALRIWDDSPDPKGPEYADAGIFLS